MKKDTVWDAFWGWAGRVPLRQKIIGIIVAPLLILGFTIAWWVSSELGGWLSYLLSEERVAQAMAVGMRSVFLITIFSAIAGLGIGWFLTWLLTRPILEITRVARHVERGNLAVRAPVWANDEIGELGRAFNAMISSLATSHQELERSNHQLKLSNQELAVLYELADMANQTYTPQQVCDRALQQVLENTKAHAGLILRFNRENPVMLASLNLPESFLKQAGCWLPDFPFTNQQAVETGEPVVIGDVSTYPGVPAELILESQRLDGRTWVLTPIAAKTNSLGLLVMLIKNPTLIMRQDRQLISAICNQLGVTIQNSLLWEEIKQKENLRAQLLNKVVSAQEEERQRISRELHDETGQALTSLLVQLKILERADNLDTVHNQVEDIRQLVEQTLQEVRRLAADLRPAALDDLGLIPTLEGYIYNFAGTTGIQVDYEAHHVEGLRLPHDVEIVLYRVIQESLTNIARHAAASHATVVVERHHKKIFATVTDNGRGFDTGILNHEGKGLGLLGMKERIQLLGGQFKLDSTQGKGTQVCIELTVPDSAIEVDS